MVGITALLVGAIGVIGSLAGSGASAVGATSVLDCQFGSNQIFDIQWNPGNYGTVGLQAAGLARPYASAAPSGPLQAADMASDDYFAFVNSTTNPGTYSLVQYDHTGTLKRVVHDTGDWTAIGTGMLFFNGGGSFGTLFSTQQAFNLGDAHTFPVTNAAPTNADALAFTDCLTYPVSQGPPTTTPPTTTTPPSTTTPAPTTPPNAGIVSLRPARLLDTRATQNPLDNGVVREIQVSGVAGVPADATAVVVNATVLDAMWDGYLTVFPCGSAVPAASTLNFTAGATRSNSATVGLGNGGKLCVVGTAVSNFVLDVTAAHSPTQGDGRIVSFAPSRLVDSRSGVKVVAGTAYEITVAGRGNVPSNATAVALNLTITDPSAAGHATVFPCGTTAPLASNINFSTGQTVANSVVAKVGTGGKVCVTTSADTHLVVDTTAAFSPTSTGSGEFVAMSPTRILDTRPSRVAAESTTEVMVAGNGGVPSGAGVVALNVTIDAAGADGFATAYPCGQSLPLASNLNFVAGQTVANGVIVAAGTGGKVCVYSTASAGLLVDVTGYYPTAV